MSARAAPPSAAPWWTPAFLGFVLPLTPDEVLVAYPCGGVTPASRREWTWIQLAQRLAWQYGEAEALARLNGYGRPELCA